MTNIRVLSQCLFVFREFAFHRCTRSLPNGCHRLSAAVWPRSSIREVKWARSSLCQSRHCCVVRPYLVGGHLYSISSGFLAWYGRVCGSIWCRKRHKNIRPYRHMSWTYTQRMLSTLIWLRRYDLTNFVDQSMNSLLQKPNIPWKHILTSLPVWALVFTHFGQNWGFYTLLTQMPKFLKDVLRFDLNEVRVVLHCWCLHNQCLFVP